MRKWANHLISSIGHAVIILLAILFVNPAQAAFLNLFLEDFPDILSSFIDVSYNEVTRQFVSRGDALEFDDDGSLPPEDIADGTFDLTASIDNTGNLSGLGGTLTIGGTVPTLGFKSGTLLTGALTAFGFPSAGGDPLEFLFDVTGGDAAGLYGAEGGVILTQTGFGGIFAVEFSGTGLGQSDTGVQSIPEPSAVLLLAGGLAGIAGCARRRRKK